MIFVVFYLSAILNTLIDQKNNHTFIFLAIGFIFCQPNVEKLSAPVFLRRTAKIILLFCRAKIRAKFIVLGLSFIKHQMSHLVQGLYKKSFQYRFFIFCNIKSWLFLAVFSTKCNIVLLFRLLRQRLRVRLQKTTSLLQIWSNSSVYHFLL